jgi:ectoine hydroxylase-related dioxygenase (phytanoyl-CoA dioxygenase family)
MTFRPSAPDRAAVPVPDGITAAGGATTDLVRKADQLRTRGYTIVRGALSPDEVVAARAALDAIFRRESALAPRRGWLTDAYRVAYMLPEKAAFFRSFCARDDLLALMRAVLGADCVLGSLNGLAMVPRGASQELHIDQTESVPGIVLTVNALYVLDDFSAETGATRLVPGSNDRVWTGDRSQIEAAEAEAIHLDAAAGSLIAYSGGSWHAGSRNRTDRPRRALHAFFARSWVRPHWDFPASLSRRVARDLDAEQRALLGYGLGPRRYDPWADRSYPGGQPGLVTRWRAILRRRLLAR